MIKQSYNECKYFKLKKYADVDIQFNECNH